MEETMKKLYEKLPVDAIQRTDKNQTHKGYDTTGYSYQFIVDRLNDVFGMDWTFDYSIIDVQRGNYNSGTPYVEISVDVTITISIENHTYIRKLAGGHTSVTFGDALKGAVTNGLKKTAALFGIGSDAFRGEIDPDDKPLPDIHENKIPSGNNTPRQGRLDFDEVTKTLNNTPVEDMEKYYNDLLTQFPSMTEKQKFALKSIFNRAAKRQDEIVNSSELFEGVAK